ncbi:MAG: FAD-dependent thymidylate synthase [Alphaproteobacteria bacterium]|jgi:thymidylate synthase (FAD)|nr:FAD-dependent thymidylate synthase [Alphaproteobacteria bacterium]
MTLEPDDRDAIDDLRAQERATRRATVPALEEVLYTPFPVLDHGFVRVVDYMGDDAAIVQAARVSYGSGTKSVRSDAGLIRYLMRHRHTTPFEMCELKLHVKLPIFVARQWIRHRTANVNEYSARYSILDREFYLPAAEAVAAQSATNRQGRGDTLPASAADEVRRRMDAHARAAFDLYDALLADGDGGDGDEGGAVARELGRAVLPLSTYTQWYWKIDLHNLLHFVALRVDPHAQAEIRAYAEVLRDLVERWVPVTAEAFRDYRLQGANLSRGQLEAIRRRLRGDVVDAADVGLSAREWRELATILGEEG